MVLQDQELLHHFLGQPCHRMPHSLLGIGLNQCDVVHDFSATVHPDDISHILSLKTSRVQTRDFLGWHYTDNGIYSVKSGYWLATHLPDNEPVAIPPVGDPHLKSQIWKLKIVPKLKHFLWRMLSRALATGEELQRRHIANNNLCCRCVTEQETTDHIFFSCSHAIQVWRASSIPLPCLVNPLVSFETKLKALFDWLGTKDDRFFEAHLPIWILWRLWKSRNKLVFQRKLNTWGKDFNEAVRDTKEWIEAGIVVPSTRYNAANGGSSVRRQAANWSRPRLGWIKCNYDGSSLNQTSKATAAWVLRDDNGCFRGAGQATGLYVRSALEAECQSLLLAMQNLWIRGYRRVSFAGDCQVLVKLTSGQMQRFDCVNWIEEIKDWAKRFEAVEFDWCSRTVNKAADLLAKAQHLEVYEFNFHSVIPRCISEHIRSDFVNSI